MDQSTLTTYRSNPAAFEYSQKVLRQEELYLFFGDGSGSGEIHTTIEELDKYIEAKISKARLETIDILRISPFDLKMFSKQVAVVKKEVDKYHPNYPTLTSQQIFSHVKRLWPLILQEKRKEIQNGFQTEDS